MSLNSVAAGAPCGRPALKAFWVQQRGDGDRSGRRREAPSLGHWACLWQTQADSPGLGGSTSARLESPEGGLLGEKRPAPRPPRPGSPAGTGSRRSHLHKGTKQSRNPHQGRSRGQRTGGRCWRSSGPVKSLLQRRGGHTPGPTGHTLASSRGTSEPPGLWTQAGPRTRRLGPGLGPCSGGTRGQGAGAAGRPPLLRAQGAGLRAGP